ncbi:MAG: hypothetical protein JNK84_13330 [Phreatobacter sp.]|uniref:hypothetical protein n=1 Tax=Phreatobacter sp. TaxID=1966341 RepID=UPI001A3A34C3|nr:hypothetical protein [Phreatobacter sp.]MBL8570046.1 hypothetical protein [Phreatobacter sp.]
MKRRPAAANDDGAGGDTERIKDMETAIAFADYLSLASKEWSALASYLFRVASADLKEKLAARNRLTDTSN